MSGTKGHSGGSNRLPTSAKILRGTFRARDARAGEPHPEPGLPPASPSLAPEVKAHYERIGALALRLGVLSTCDGPALELAARAAAEIDAADDLIAKGGLLMRINTRYGWSVRSNPAVKIRADASRRLRDSLRGFGLDPQSRGTVEALAPPSEAERREERLGRKYFGGP